MHLCVHTCGSQRLTLDVIFPQTLSTLVLKIGSAAGTSGSQIKLG